MQVSIFAGETAGINYLLNSPRSSMHSNGNNLPLAGTLFALQLCSAKRYTPETTLEHALKSTAQIYHIFLHLQRVIGVISV